MKTYLSAIFLGLFAVSYSQVITEEEFRNKVKAAQENCVGAHENVVYRTNAGFATDLWERDVRFNNALIVKFFNQPSAQKIVSGVDLNMQDKKNWAYTITQQEAANLLGLHGVKITNSHGNLLINARQNQLYAESVVDGQKIILDLYCPKEEFLEILRIGKEQSIEFQITGYWATPGADHQLTGVLTGVSAVKQTVSCSNGHEYDKALGYKFCPKCGQPLE